MSLKDKSDEIQRLIDAFEKEAAKFHDIQFHNYRVTQNGGPLLSRRFRQPNHAITLWQYYGKMDTGIGIERFMSDLAQSNQEWGLRGSELTSVGIIEGSETPLFVRMATRAGSLFSEDESYDIKSRVLSEIQEHEKAEKTSGKPMAVVNGNPLAIWLNFLLYHLSQSNPRSKRTHKIEPDPFSLSLLALERLGIEQSVVKADRSTAVLKDLKFKVAVSFPGEKRVYVSQVVESLRGPLGKDTIFYDYDYKAQLARPNLDTLLQRIYRDQSDLIVVFLCAAYAKKEWCGLEWRVVRDIIKAKEDERVMFVRLDDAPVDGVLSIDGYIEGTSNTPQQVADFICIRIAELENGS